MANTEFLNLKLPATSDNIAEQINIDAPDNLSKIDASLKAVHTVTKESIAENYLSAHSIPSTAKRGKLDVKLRGQSIVNLLGADGNCESTTSWATFQSSIALDDNKVFGNKGIKITANGGHTSFYKNITTLIKLDRYYFASAYVKNGNLTNGIYPLFSVTGGTNVGGTPNLSTQFKRVGVKISPTQLTGATDISIQIYSANATSGQYGYADGIMVNEISADDYNNLSVDELMVKYPYHDGLQGAKPTVKSCGKNLFDYKNINKWVAEKKQVVLNTDGSLSVFRIDNEDNMTASRLKTPVKANTSYTISFKHKRILGTNNSRYDLHYYDKNNSVILSNTFNFATATTGVYVDHSKTITTPENAMYFEIKLLCVAIGDEYWIKDIQFEEGSVATAYEPYKGTEVQYKTLDGQPITLHKLPNGVCDEITDDGKFIKRIKEKTITESDVFSMHTSFSNVDFAKIPKPSDYIGYNTLTNGNYKLGVYPEKPNITDDVSYVGTVTGNAEETNFFIGVTNGTTLANAKTALAGTKLIYQLAQPQILDTNATPLVAEPNGNVFITSDGTQPSVELSYPINLGAVVDGLIEGQKGLGQFIEGGINSLEAKKLDKTKQGWIALSPQNGWTGTLYYRKNQAELIEIQGNVTAGTRTAGTVIAVFPEGYRPSRYTPIESYITSLSKVINGLVLTNDSGELRIYAPATTDIGSGNTITICKVLP